MTLVTLMVTFAGFAVTNDRNILWHCNCSVWIPLVFRRSIRSCIPHSVIAADLDCVHTIPAHFENGEKCDG